jgi:CAI-1 autoinducer synthase
VDQHCEARVAGEWKGNHLLRGGRHPKPRDLILKTNDYLALTNHPDVIEAQVADLRAHGNGLMMSAVFFNERNPQWLFQEAMAEHLRTETTMVAQSGYLANVGLIQSIADSRTPVYLDMLAHASLWHGAQAAGAELRPFRHNDVEHLTRQLDKHGPGVVIIDSVYSTNGSIAPIREIVDAAEVRGAAIVVDESHSIGTHGPAGAGMIVDLGLEERVHFRTASLAKAFCGRGGIVACSRRFGEYLTYTSPPNIFSSALLPHEFASLGKILEIIRRDEWRRRRLHANSAWLRHQLEGLGYNLADSASQIIALESGSEAQTIVLRDALEARGIFAAPFCAPATPKKRACMRLSVNCTLSQEELCRIVEVCADIREEVGMWNWPSTRRLMRKPEKAAARRAA